MLGLQAGARLVVVPALILMTLPKGLGDPGHYFVVESETFEELGEALLQHLLTRVPLRALSLRAGAVVVDVAALLDLRNEGATAVATDDEAQKRKVMF